MTTTQTEILNPTPDLVSARVALQGFLANQPQESRVTCIHDCDADGVAAGVLWQRMMERLGFVKAERVIPDRERNVWTPQNRERVQERNPEYLWVLDLGSRSEAPLEGVPTCLIDHHRPEGVPPGSTLITGYSWDPVPCTALLMWELAWTLVDMSEFDWIAAIGVISDLGEKAPFDVLTSAKKKYTARWLKEATALINAPRRASRYRPEVAANALLHHPNPKSLATSDDPDVYVLKESRAEVKAALDQARKAAPVFSGPVALLRMNTPCQVHPLIAQQWRGRLPKYIVIAANEGYMPGRVNFSARTQSEYNVLDFLNGLELSAGEGTFGHGHDKASGGSLPVERWNELLAKLGFPTTIFAPA